ncbi:hypothetical protein [Flindersiella endophytica]
MPASRGDVVGLRPPLANRARIRSSRYYATPITGHPAGDGGEVDQQDSRRAALDRPADPDPAVRNALLRGATVEQDDSAARLVT